jgi:hypothetical protein
MEPKLEKDLLENCGVLLDICGFRFENLFASKDFLGLIGPLGASLTMFAIPVKKLESFGILESAHAF